MSLNCLHCQCGATTPNRCPVNMCHSVIRSVATYMKEVMKLYHAYRYVGALCPASLLLQTHRCLVSTSCTAGAKVYAPSGHQRVTANPRKTEARPPSRLPPAAGATLRQRLCHTNRRLVRLHQPDPIRSTQPLLNAARRKYERQRSNAASAHVAVCKNQARARLGRCQTQAQAQGHQTTVRRNSEPGQTGVEPPAAPRPPAAQQADMLRPRLPTLPALLQQCCALGAHAAGRSSSPIHATRATSFAARQPTAAPCLWGPH